MRVVGSEPEIRYDQVGSGMIDSILAIKDLPIIENKGSEDEFDLFENIIRKP